MLLINNLAYQISRKIYLTKTTPEIFMFFKVLIYFQNKDFLILLIFVQI